MYLDKINKFLPQYQNLDKFFFVSMVQNLAKNGPIVYKYEKDFLLTLILAKIGENEKYKDLIFKGGTCLNKVYFPYFRLSEDLDFVVNGYGLSQKARRTLLVKYEKQFKEDLSILGLKLRELRTRYDGYKLEVMTFEYVSVLDSSIQTIKIDISMKNNLYFPAYKGEIKSIFKDNILEENIFSRHFVNCIDLKEATAEKLRAGLTRLKPAIRDFFDIWYIRENSDFNFKDKEFLNLLDLKLKQMDYKYTLEENFANLKKQIETDLQPVLAENYDFLFEETYQFILDFKTNK